MKLNAKKKIVLSVSFTKMAVDGRETFISGLLLLTFSRKTALKMSKHGFLSLLVIISFAYFIFGLIMK